MKLMNYLQKKHNNRFKKIYNRHSYKMINKKIWIICQNKLMNNR